MIVDFSVFLLGIRPTTFCNWEELIGVQWDLLANESMESCREQEYKAAEVDSSGYADVSVIGDGGWGKRSLGHSYDALTGIWRQHFSIHKLVFYYY